MCKFPVFLSAELQGKGLESRLEKQVWVAINVFISF